MTPPDELTDREKATMNAEWERTVTELCGLDGEERAAFFEGWLAARGFYTTQQPVGERPSTPEREAISEARKAIAFLRVCCRSGEHTGADHPMVIEAARKLADVSPPAVASDNQKEERDAR